MREKMNALKEKAILSIQNVETLQEIDEIRVEDLGKKGKITEISKSMRDLSPEERPAFGQLVNEVKVFITELVDNKTNEIKEIVKNEQLKLETLDITLPGRDISVGSLHPITETMNFLKNIFIEIGRAHV